MPITQNQIVAEMAKIDDEILDLKQQIVDKQALKRALNVLSAQMGGAPPVRRKAKRKTPKISKKCTTRGCPRKGQVFATQAAYTRHSNREHSSAVVLREVA